MSLFNLNAKVHDYNKVHNFSLDIADLGNYEE